MFLFRRSFPSHTRSVWNRGVQHPCITASSCQSRLLGTKNGKKAPIFEPKKNSPARDLLSGKIKVSQLTKKDLRAVLDSQNERYDPKEDRAFLRKRVVSVLVRLAQMEATMTPEAREYQSSRRAELQMYLPRSCLAVAPALTGMRREVLIFVPLWDFESAREIAMRDPLDWATHCPWAQSALVTYFENERRLTEQQPLTAVSKIGAAALALYFDASDNVRLVEPWEIQKDNDETPTKLFHEVHYMYDSPVPKGFTHTPPPELPEEIRDKIVAAIEDVRQHFDSNDD